MRALLSVGAAWRLFSILGQFYPGFPGHRDPYDAASAPLHNALLGVLVAYPECWESGDPSWRRTKGFQQSQITFTAGN